jgi:hypothetical protein
MRVSGYIRSKASATFCIPAIGFVEFSGTMPGM